MRAAVVGHVEWVQFFRVPQTPSAGDIVHASDWWEEPAGGGAGAAVQLLKLCDEALFLTALGNDELGHRSYDALSGWGLEVETVFRDEPTRRAVTLIDADGERTITVAGKRLAPHASDPLAWDDLAHVDIAFVTAADADALRAARRAGTLVATSRILPLLADAHVYLDAVVGSALDPSEEYVPGALDPPPGIVVRTMGADGGTVEVHGEEPRRFAAPPLPGPIVDRYGAGDAFAAGLTYGLAAGLRPLVAAELAARCGAAVVTGRGPYDGQLGRRDLP